MGSKYRVEIDDDSYDPQSGSADIVDISEGEGLLIPPGCVAWFIVLVVVVVVLYAASTGGDCTSWTQNPTGDWYCTSNW